MPLDERKQSGICGARSGDEVEAMRRVLGEFFVRMDDGHYNRRLQREIEKSQALSAKRKDAGFNGYLARAKQLPSKRSATASNTNTNTNPSTNTNTIFKSKTTSKGKTSAQAPCEIPEWIPQDHWDAWIESRKKARKAPTEYAKTLAIRKLDNLREQGHAPAQVLMQSAFNGWSDLYPPKEPK